MSKTKKPQGRALPARVSDATHKRVLSFRAHLAKEQPGANPSLSDAVRVLIELGLSEKGL